VPSTNTVAVTTTNGSKNFAANDLIAILLTLHQKQSRFLSLNFACCKQELLKSLPARAYDLWLSSRWPLFWS